MNKIGKKRKLGVMASFSQADIIIDFLKLADEYGVDVVNLGNVPGFLDKTDHTYAPRIAKFFEKSRIRPYSWHTLWCGFFKNERWCPEGRGYSCDALDPTEARQRLKYFLDAAEVAMRLGFKVLDVHLSDNSHWVPGSDREKIKTASLDFLKRAAERVEHMGGKIAMENLTPPNLGSSAEELSYFIENTDRKIVGVCLDTGHANLLPDGGAKLTRSLKGHIFSTHIHDNFGDKDAHIMPMSGNINWRDQVKAFEDADYPGPFIYETGPKGLEGGPAMQAIKNNFHRLITTEDNITRKETS